MINFLSLQNKTKVLAVYKSDMINETKLLEKLVKKDVFADLGNFAVGYTYNKDLIKEPKVNNKICYIQNTL